MLLHTDLQDCCLRPWKAEDKKNLVNNANNHKIWRNLAHMFPHPYTEADAEFWISFANEPSSSTHLAIEFQGVAVGGIGIISGEGVFCRTGQFGYWIGEPYWGKGIATAAARAMVQHAWQSLPLARLEAPVIEWNPASMRVLEKVAFVREGILRHSVFKDGQLVDSIMYALVRNA